MAYKFDDPRDFRFKEGGLFLGLDPDGHEIGVTTERHALTIGGAGAGKGAALLVPNARRWPHSLLVIDPKGENAALSWQDRRAKGQAVYVLDPFKVADVPANLRASFNPLAGLDPANLSAREDIEVIADGMVRRDNKDHAQWDDGAAMVLAGVIAYVMQSAPPDRRNLASVRAVLMQEKAALYENAQRMMDAPAFGGLARAAGVAILTGLDSDESMEADFINSARRHSKWIDSPAMSSVLEKSSFNLAEIKTGRASVYLVLPPHYIQTHAAFLRLFVRCGINAMAAGGSGKGGRCLFLLDEFFALGKIEEIAKAAGLMRSYGVHLWPFLQDLGQLQELYGRTGSETFFGNADAVTFLGNTDTLTLRYASEKIGALTPQEIAAAPPKARTPAAKSSPFADEKAQAVENENARRAAQDKANNARAQYDHAMKTAGQPRLTPQEIAALVGKGDGDAVARSMIAFLPRAAVLQLTLAPYFQPAPASAKPEKKVERAAPQREKSAPAFTESAYLDETAPAAAALRRQVFGAPIESYNIALSVVGCDLLFAVLFLRAFGGPYDLQSFFISCFFVAPAAMIAGALAAWLIRDISSPVIPLGLWKFIGWPAFAAVIAFALTGSGPVALSVGALTFAGFFLWAIWRIRPV